MRLNQNLNPTEEHRYPIARVSAHLNLDLKSLLGQLEVRQAALIDLDTDTAHVLLEAGVDVCLQGLDHRVGALRTQEPGAAAKVVLVHDHEVQDAVELGIGQTLGGGDVGDLGTDVLEGLGVLQVEGGHLHVGSALARAAGEGVALVGELAGLEGHEGDDSGHLVGVLQAVLAEAVEDEGSGLLGSAALIGLAVAAGGVGGDVLDDLSGGERGRGAGGQAEGDGDKGRELHGDWW